MRACLHYGRIAIIAGVGILIPWDEADKFLDARAAQIEEGE